MRFNITFNRTGKQRMLPMDYQYYIGAWIYKVIGLADREFAAFLHHQGYSDGNKQFKLFNYSPLNFGKPTLWKEKSLFEIGVDTVYLQVSFYMPDAAERFIVGLFNNQQVFVGDRFNGIDLAVSQIERLPEPVVSKTMGYRAKSPVVISILNEGDKYANYLSPVDSNYTVYLKNNLTQKWRTVPGAQPLSDDIDFEWAVTNEPKSKLVTVKPYTPQQSKVRGFVYDFTLKAPEEIHRLILSAGIGEKNSTGFGWCEPQFDYQR
jgi:CRISPR-associated endoribonuclease Cas6